MTVERNRKAGFEVIEIIDQKTDSKATLYPERGGILLELRLNGREMLYLNEEVFADSSKNIRGGNPVLFPICGFLTNETYTVGDQAYALKQHGFARNKAWKVEAIDENMVTLSLSDDAETRAVYPFRFKLYFTYTLENGECIITQKYENHSDQKMPFYAGFHPYFNVNHHEMSYQIPSTTYLDFPDLQMKELACPLEKLKIDDAKVFINLSEQKAVFGLENQKTVITFSDHFANVVVWSESDTEYVCVEPFMAGPDAFNKGEKMIELSPQADTTAWFRIASIND